MTAIRRRLRLAWLLCSAATADWIVTHPRVHDALTYLTDVLRGRGRGHGLHVLPAGETDLPLEEVMPHAAANHRGHGRHVNLPGLHLDDRGAAAGAGQAGELYPPDYTAYSGLHWSHDANRRHWQEVAWQAVDPDGDDVIEAFAATSTLATQPEPTQRTMGYWPMTPPRDTAVDASLLAAIRLHVDGQYTGQIVDRYFSQVSVTRIFDDTCGPLLRRLAVTA